MLRSADRVVIQGIPLLTWILPCLAVSQTDRIEMIWGFLLARAVFPGHL